MPLISVIIPIFRVESYIIRCLDSVCNQTFKDFEIILVDDCTDDESVEFAVSFLKKKDVSFQLISHAYNQGLSAARNTGITHASGEFVYFLDGDDSIKENCLELLINCFKENPDIDFSMAKYCRVLQNGIINELFSYPLKKKVCLKKEIIDLYRRSVLPWNAVNRLIKKEFIINNKIFFRLGITSEDLMWNFEVLSKVSKISIIDISTYKYYVSSNSIMATSVSYSYIADIFRILSRMYEICEEHKNISLVKYYLYLKYVFFSNSLLWRRYHWAFLYISLKKNYTDRFVYYKYNKLRNKVLFLFPSSFIVIVEIVVFYLKQYINLLFYKLSKICQ